MKEQVVEEKKIFLERKSYYALPLLKPIVTSSKS